MLTLSPNECRVLGVLVEKAQTTPGQYPMTLNSLVVGCNQKNNRLPITALEEDQVIDALDGLRAKQLSREVMLSGSRVAKYRHTARETLEVSTSELVVLAELLLRGPQTVGEIRGRASRMHPIESIEVVETVLNSLSDREPPMVREVGAAPGGRANRFAQLLCIDLHSVVPVAEPSTGRSGLSNSAATQNDDLSERIESLEQQVGDLAAEVERLKAVLSSGVHRGVV